MFKLVVSIIQVSRFLLRIFHPYDGYTISMDTSILTFMEGLLCGEVRQKIKKEKGKSIMEISRGSPTSLWINVSLHWCFLVETGSSSAYSSLSAEGSCLNLGFVCLFVCLFLLTSFTSQRL
jgi:hypothetical protein